MDPSPGVPQICSAIDQKRRISFVYNGRKRVGEPQCYGIGTRDKELLRVFLIEGITREREPLFSVTGIEELELLDQTFKRRDRTTRRTTRR